MNSDSVANQQSLFSRSGGTSLFGEFASGGATSRSFSTADYLSLNNEAQTALVRARIDKLQVRVRAEQADARRAPGVARVLRRLRRTVNVDEEEEVKPLEPLPELEPLTPKQHWSESVRRASRQQTDNTSMSSKTTTTTSSSSVKQHASVLQPKSPRLPLARSGKTEFDSLSLNSVRRMPSPLRSDDEDEEEDTDNDNTDRRPPFEAWLSSDASSSDSLLDALIFAAAADHEPPPTIVLLKQIANNHKSK